MATARELEAQARWEVEAARRGAKRYREAKRGKPIDETAGGSALLRKVVARLTAKVKEKQAAFRSPKLAGDVAETIRWGLVQLDPAVVAYVVTSLVLRGASGATAAHPGVPAPVFFLSHQIGEALRVQLDYDLWAAKANKEKDTPSAKALAAMKKGKKGSALAHWKHWKRKLELVEEKRWTLPTSVQLGAYLISALLEVAPEVFREVTLSSGFGHRPQLRIDLTDEARAALEDRETRAEMARPEHMPMLIPPLPWRWEEPKPKET